MSSATNRTELLAKALKQCRPDFSLHNARVFARTVIDAPDGVFGAKPLRFLPGGQTVPARTHEAPIVGTNIDGPLHVAARVRNADDVVVLPITFSVAEIYRPPAPEMGGAAAPVSLAEAAIGDLVFCADGTPGLSLGNGKMLVGDSEIDAGEQLASRLLRRRDDGVGNDVPAAQPSTDRGSDRLARRENVASTRPPAIPRPAVPENGTRRSAADRWHSTYFALGATEGGTPVSWWPRVAGPLAVVGPTGSGKSVVPESLLEQARAAGWMTLHATTARETRDPWDTPGLVASTVPWNGFGECGVNEFSAVIELARRIIINRRSRTFDEPSNSGSALLDRYAPDVPVLVVLEGIDTYLQQYRESAGTSEEMSAVRDLLRLLLQGHGDRIHVVLEAQRWAEELPDLWSLDLPSVVVAGMPEPALAKRIVGVQFPDDLRRRPGRMTWVDRGVDSAGGELFTGRPFQAYSGGPKPRVVSGQYPRLALYAGGVDYLGPRAVGLHELAELPAVLLDREVHTRWEPDPRYSHLGPWARFR